MEESIKQTTQAAETETTAAKKTTAKKTAAKKTTTKKAAAKKPATKKTTKKEGEAKPAAKRRKAHAKGATLVIVESPAKAHTIGKFLGSKYYVTASQGHVRDLPKKQLGVDVENGFTPKYTQMTGKSAILSEIKTEAKAADHVLLATDPDREGEAISWHIAKVLGIDENSDCRIEFNEITEKAVKNAIEHARPIDVDRVNAQQARRILDRLVGYKISPILWKKVRTGLSAGRVQSVAVRMICDRDREIEAFEPQEYWTLSARFSEEKQGQKFEAKLEKINRKKAELKDKVQAETVQEDVCGYEYKVKSVKKGKRTRKAPAPFTTSTLQQESSRKLGYSPSNTMRLAQQLYEGIDLEGQGAVGLVTYIRTDSVRIAAEAVSQAREYIEKTFGPQYLPEKPNFYRNRNRSQDAHEAIRPTSLYRTPKSMKGSLDAQQYRLYELIYNRFVASQMAGEVSDTLTADIEGGPYTFRTTGSIVRFDGYRVLYVEGKDEKEEEGASQLPELEEGVDCTLEKAEGKQHFTQPPARFSEATLVKALEEQGIGRPSTYATIISTIIDREYIEREGRQLRATQLGFIVNDFMKKNFPQIVDTKFTAEMETKLDEVEEGQDDWQKMLGDFYTPFAETLEKATNTERVKMPEEVTDIPCEKCGAMMVVKSGRYGKFLACPNYPECKNTKPLIEDIGVPCPKCGKKVVKKKSKRGKVFFGCEGYPECDFVSWDQPVLDKCEVCGGDMVLKFGRNRVPYHQCTNPECKHRQYTKKEKKKDETT
ncbi:MAG: type I DNA topoisomerase [Christensenellales bacterium]|jgi:DNA topoisomerase-1